MKRRYTQAIVLALLMLFAFAPAAVWGMDKQTAGFDWDKMDESYHAVYYGNPSFTICLDGTTCDITPGDDDYIIVETDDGKTVRCKFRPNTDEDVDEGTGEDIDEDTGEGVDEDNEEDTDEVYYYLYDEEGNDVECYAEYLGPGQIGLYVCRYKEDAYVNFDEEDVIWEGYVYFSNVTVHNNVDRIAFSPSTITLYSENIRETDEEGKPYFDLYSRAKHSREGMEWTSPFAEGDRLTVYYSNGTSRTFVNRVVYDEYADSWEDLFYDGEDMIYVDVDPEELNAGSNSVVVSHHGRSTRVNVIVETPQVIAERARIAAEERARAEAQAIENARQGVYDPSLPKVKAKKHTAKKAKATVKWTKLKKKQLKKSKATNYEIWVCPNTGFARGETIERIVGKGKASLNIGGLQKNTKYFVKIRAIKYVNGVKHVGPWNHKTVKTKKK